MAQFNFFPSAVEAITDLTEEAGLWDQELQTCGTHGHTPMSMNELEWKHL